MYPILDKIIDLELVTSDDVTILKLSGSCQSMSTSKKKCRKAGQKYSNCSVIRNIRTTQSPNPIQQKKQIFIRSNGPSSISIPYQSWNKHVLHVIGADTFFNSRSSPLGGVSPPDWSARLIEFGLVAEGYGGLWKIYHMSYKKKCPVKIGWEWKLIKRGDREATEAWPQTDNGHDL